MAQVRSAAVCLAWCSPCYVWRGALQSYRHWLGRALLCFSVPKQCVQHVEALLFLCPCLCLGTALPARSLFLRCLLLPRVPLLLQCPLCTPWAACGTPSSLSTHSRRRALVSFLPCLPCPAAAMLHRRPQAPVHVAGNIAKHAGRLGSRYCAAHFLRAFSHHTCLLPCLPAGWTFDMADAGRFRNAMGDALYTYREHKDSFRWVGQRARGWNAASDVSHGLPAGRPPNQLRALHACL